MIKINLVSEGRKPVVARKAKEALGVGDTSMAELLLGVAVAIGLVFIGGYWWHLKGEIKQRDQSIAEAQKEVQALQQVLKEVDDYKQKKAELEHKIDVINELKRNQWGPVKIMDQISRALPQLLWLENMTLRGNTVTLQGKAFNTNQVATFIENLDKVPEFQEPHLKQTNKQGGVYGFDITFNFSFAKKEDEGDKAKAATGAAAAGG